MTYKRENIFKIFFYLDPGFTATGSCASTITFIDGDKGELRYRGYNIEVNIFFKKIL